MRVCEICGAEIPDGQSACPKCGFIYRTEAMTQAEVPYQDYSTYEASAYGTPTYLDSDEPYSFRSRRANVTRNIRKKRALPMIVLGTCLLFAGITSSFMASNVMTGSIISNTTTYESVLDLEEDYPELAEIIKAKKETLEVVDLDDYNLYESYEVEDGDLESAYISYSGYTNSRSESICLSYYGYDWVVESSVQFNDPSKAKFDEKTLAPLTYYNDMDIYKVITECKNAYETHKDDTHGTNKDDDYLFSDIFIDEDNFVKMYMNLEEDWRFMSFSVENEIE